MWHSYEPRGNKVYQQQLIRWLRRWCAAQHILRNPNETPVHSGNIRSDFVSDGNPIDGRGLLWLIRLQHFIYCIFISARLSCQNNRARKTRTRVQVAPAAIVCTGYDTVRHFASPINRTASLQNALVCCIPLWPFEPQENGCELLTQLSKNLLQSFLLAARRCALRWGSLEGSGEESNSEGSDSRGLAQSLASLLSSPQCSVREGFGSAEAWYIDKLFAVWIFIILPRFRGTEPGMLPAR